VHVSVTRDDRNAAVAVPVCSSIVSRVLTVGLEDDPQPATSASTRATTGARNTHHTTTSTNAECPFST
jgi:hypothetical protein